LVGVDGGVFEEISWDASNSGWEIEGVKSVW
jgi:hypothetical protein